MTIYNTIDNTTNRVDDSNLNFLLNMVRGL